MNQHATNAATANFIAQFRLVWIVAVILLASSVACGQDLPVRGEVPDGTGQLESVPALFSGGVDEQGRNYLLNGQLATNGKLILTASNGFFDNGVCRAKGESLLSKVGDDSLIKPNFAFLDQ